MSSLVQDLRFALRTLAQRPAFTVLATLVLALGIGSTTAIFSVVDAVVLRPMPYPDPGRLVVVWEANETNGLPFMHVAPPNLADWRARSRSFDALGAWRNLSYTIQRQTTAEQLYGTALSHDMFAALGVTPLLGRVFAGSEHEGAGAPVVLISYAYWRRVFGGDSTVIGKTLQVDGTSRQIVGVMPETFNFAPPVALEGIAAPRRNDIWTPLAANDLSNQRGAHYLLVLGRLRANVSPAAAETELRGIAEQIAAENPSTNAGWSARVVPLDRQVTGDQRPALSALGIAVALVLLLACANVAALVLARGVGRRRELAIRAALGATRRRIARQLLTESFVLAIAGGVAGSVLASWMARAVRSLGGPLLPRLGEVTVDARALGFALLACIAAAALFGTLPALHASRQGDAESLKYRGSAARTGRLQSAMVVMELALSVVLLSAAALLGAAFVRLIQTDPGFRPAQVVTTHLTLPRVRYATRAQRTAFLDRVLDRLRAMPAVSSAGAIDAAPLADDRQGTGVTIEGRTPAPGDDDATVNFAFVTPGYFEALGVSLVRGRTFTARDGSDAPPVIVVNQTFASRFFGEQDPLGHRVRAGFNTQTPREIVGVVGDERHISLAASAPPGVYVTFAQAAWNTRISLVVRTTTTAAAATAALREAVMAVDPEVPLYDTRTMEEIVAHSVSGPRFAAALIAAFALVALGLSAVGVYGVVSQTVGQRIAEFGLRLALGAAPSDLRRLVVQFAAGLAALGVAVGIPVAVGFGRVLSSLLEGVRANDPLAYGGTALVLVAAVLAAALWPAYRASRIDPIVALRTE